jgi:hypothetical protein
LVALGVPPTMNRELLPGTHSPPVTDTPGERVCHFAPLESGSDWKPAGEKAYRVLLNTVEQWPVRSSGGFGIDMFGQSQPRQRDEQSVQRFRESVEEVSKLRLVIKVRTRSS